MQIKHFFLVSFWRFQHFKYILQNPKLKQMAQMRNIFKVETVIQVPIYFIYLDGGQVPAIYTIKIFRLNFLQYILHQKESSLLYRMLEAQQKQPVKGDWFSECTQIKNLK